MTPFQNAVNIANKINQARFERGLQESDMFFNLTYGGKYVEYMMENEFHWSDQWRFKYYVTVEGVVHETPID